MNSRNLRQLDYKNHLAVDPREGIAYSTSRSSSPGFAERLERGNIVMLLADSGWKYLSTNLWSRDYDEMAEEVEGKVWW